MIRLGDVYKVVAAMAPLYVASLLGFCSVRCWHLFKAEDVDAINRFNYYIVIPFFAFQFSSNINPYQMNIKFILADIISKAIIVIFILLWANCTRKGSYSWAVTCFSLCSLTNSLIVGVPLIGSMYGEIGADIVVQSFVLQSLLWFLALLFLLELHRVRNDLSQKLSDTNINGNGDQGHSIEGQEIAVHPSEMDNVTPSFLYLMKIVGYKLLFNHNCISCFMGITWALISNRWHIQLPSIVEGSIIIFAKAGGSVSMFSLGLFIALQEKFISCGVYLTLMGLLLRFVVAPVAMTIGSVAMGLHGEMLHVSILQAAIPQSVTSFVFAKQYGLHETVLSTVVIFGTLLSLPLLIAYFAILESIH